MTGPKYLGAYDKQIAIFSQVAGAIRDDGEDARHDHQDNTLIFYQQKYHWAWFIPLDDEVVSVGIVIPAAYFLDKKETKRDFFIRELRELHPELKRRIPEIKLVEDVHVIPNYSYQVKAFCGKGFICIGDSHRFIDPIFSFGLTVGDAGGAVRGAARSSAYLEASTATRANPFAEHQLFCEKGIDVLEDVLDSFWEHPLAFAWSVYHALHGVHDRHVRRAHLRSSSRRRRCRFPQVSRPRGQREQSYEVRGSVFDPIGSRYHPERAAIWEVNAPVESTEGWLGPR